MGKDQQPIKKSMSTFIVKISICMYLVLRCQAAWRRRCVSSVCTATSWCSRSRPSNHSTRLTRRTRPLLRWSSFKVSHLYFPKWDSYFCLFCVDEEVLFSLVCLLLLLLLSSGVAAPGHLLHLHPDAGGVHEPRQPQRDLWPPPPRQGNSDFMKLSENNNSFICFLNTFYTELLKD